MKSVRFRSAAAHLGLCWLVFFFWRPYEIQLELCRMVLAAVTAADAACLLKGGELRLPATVPQKLAVWAVGCWTVFACFANGIFNVSGEMLLISADRLLFLLAAGALLAPVVTCTVELMEKAAALWRPGKEHRRRDKVLTALLFLGVLLAEQILLWLAFFPGGIPGDAVNIIGQATGAVPMSDDHPFLNILITQGLLKLWPNVAVLPLFQMISAAVITAAVLYELWLAGGSPAALITLGMVFLLLPNNLMNNVTYLKDTPFTIALTGLVLQLWKQLARREKPQGVLWSLETALCCFSVLALRPNGIIAGYSCCLLLAVLAAFAWRKHGFACARRLLAAALIPLLAFALWQGPVKKALNVQEGDPKTTIFVADALGAVAHRGYPLREETVAIMERVQPLEDWAGRYDPWIGPDAYFVNSHFDMSAISTGEALKMYAEVLTRYPAVVLQDRLNGSDVVWDVLEPEPVEYCRHFYYDLEYLPDGLTGPVPQSFLTEFAWRLNVWYMKNVYLTLDTEPVASALLWRSGPSIILLMVLMLLWLKRRASGLMLASVPLVMHIAGLLMSVYHQSFRYTWAVQMIAAALVPLTLATLKGKGDEA